MEFKLEGAGDFDQFRPYGARARLQQPGGLHGQSGATGDDPARAQILKRGARQSERVDAGMAPEMPVLGRDEGVEQDGRDIGDFGPEPPDAFGRGQQRDGAALAVEDFSAGCGQAGEMRRVGAVEDDQTGQEGRHGDAKDDCPAPPAGRDMAWHRGRFQRVSF